MEVDIKGPPAESHRRTLSFYIVFLGVVVPLWSAIPISWLVVIRALVTRRIWSTSWTGKAFLFLMFFEVLFSIYHYHLSRRVSGPAPYGPWDPVEIQAAYERLLKAGLANLPEDGDDIESERPGSPAEDIIQLEHDDTRAVEFRNCLRTWFYKVPWSSIRLHELQKWLYWSIFNAEMPSPESLPDSHRAILNRALDMLQKRSGCKVQEGSNPAARPMCITTDNVNIMWRPLSYYLSIFLINRCLEKWHKIRWNASYGYYEGLEYLIRAPKCWDSINGPRPIIFIHGLGLGLLQYNSIITHLFESFSDRPLLILLQPHISQDIFHPQYLQPMNRHQTAYRLAGLLNQLGWVHTIASGVNNPGDDIEEEKGTNPSVSKQEGVTMLSHSNGSYTHAWMLKGYPKMIGRSCFVDPVAFCSWEGDVCYNFIHRPCKTGMEVLMRYVVGAEIGVANLLQRHFDWASNSLWYEDIPNARNPSKALFLLGGKDSIIHSERVKRYLTSHGVKRGIWYDPDGTHGQPLRPGTRGHTEVLKWLRG